MNHFPLLAFGCCLALALAHAAVAVLQRVRGPSVTLENMRQRAWSWWQLMLVGVPTLLVPAPGAVLLFGVLAACAVSEFMEAAQAPRRAQLPWLYLAIPLVFNAVDRKSLLGAGIALGLVIGVAVSVRYRRRLVLTGVLICVAGLTSLAWLALQDPRSGALLLLGLLVTQASDAGQYVFGKLFGKTPLAPRLSPKKTWEGLLGGAGVAVTVGALVAHGWGWGWGEACFLSSMAAMTGVLGGLLMSALKRHLRIKDWGSRLKGHGGILDRVDSLLLTGPAFVLCYWLGV